MNDVSENGSQTSDISDTLRQLALVDRIIGLEAEVARLSVEASGAPPTDEVASLRHQIELMRSSATWRVGHLVLSPIRFVRRMIRAK